MIKTGVLIGIFIAVILYVQVSANISAQVVVTDPENDAPDSVYGLDWTSDYSMYAVGRLDGTTDIVDAMSGQITRTIQSDSIGATFAVDWHPDPASNLLATTGTSGIITIWDTSTGLPEKTFDMEFDSSDVEWSPTGSRILGIALDGRARIWDYDDPDTFLFEHHTVTNAVAGGWSPVTGDIAIANGIRIEVIDGSDGTPITTFDIYLNYAADLAWHPTLNQMVSVDFVRCIRIWEVSSQTEADSFCNTGIEPDHLLAVEYSSDGTQIITGDEQGRLIFWDPATWEPIEIVSNDGMINALAVNAQGDIAFGDRDGDHGVIDLGTDLENDISTPTAIPHDDDATALRDLLSDPACEQACYLGIEPQVTTQSEVVSILDNEEIDNYRWKPLSDNVGFFSWIPPTEQPLVNTGSRIGDAQIVVRDELVFQISVPIHADINTIIDAFGEPDFIRRDDEFYQLGYQDLGLLFQMRISIDLNRTVLVFISDSTSEGTQLNNGSGEPVDQPCPTYGAPPCIAPTAVPQESESELYQHISHVEWSPLQTLLAIGRINGNIEVINADTNEIVESWSTNEWAIADIDWHPDTNLLATGSGDGFIHIWEIGNNQPLQTLLHNAGVVDVEWIPSQNQLTSVANVADTSRNFKVWDTSTWIDVTSLDQTSVTYRLEANAEGTPFISPIDRYIVNESFYPVDTIDFVTPPDPMPTFVSAAWHPTQSNIIGPGTLEGTVYIHNPDTNRALQVLPANETANTDPYIRSVKDVAFSPSGNFFYSVSTDGTLLIWDTTSWLVVETLSLNTTVTKAAFSADGNHLAYGSEDEFDIITLYFEQHTDE